MNGTKKIDDRCIKQLTNVRSHQWMNARRIVIKLSIIAASIILPSVSFGQWGVSFHHSNLPFAGVNYEIKNKWRPELRVGTDVFLKTFLLKAW
jgi:hypothetical protein